MEAKVSPYVCVARVVKGWTVGRAVSRAPLVNHA